MMDAMEEADRIIEEWAATPTIWPIPDSDALAVLRGAIARVLSERDTAAEQRLNEANERAKIVLAAKDEWANRAGIAEAQLRERERELKEEGRSGDRREAEMAEQRDLAYAKYDEAQQEVERLREALGRIERGDQGITAQIAHNALGHAGPYFRCDDLLTHRPAPENT